MLERETRESNFRVLPSIPNLVQCVWCCPFREVWMISSGKVMRCIGSAFVHGNCQGRNAKCQLHYGSSSLVYYHKRTPRSTYTRTRRNRLPVDRVVFTNWNCNTPIKSCNSSPPPHSYSLLFLEKNCEQNFFHDLDVELWKNYSANDFTLFRESCGLSVSPTFSLPFFFFFFFFLIQPIAPRQYFTIKL